MDIAALYWTYANWARKDEFDKLGAIARNDPPKLLALAERALAVDETYISYGPYRSLAAFWGGLPPFPLIAFGQNLPLSLSYICPVIDEPGYCADCLDCPIDANCNAYFENRLIFAEYYLMEKELWEDAERVLRSILTDPIGESYPLYNALCQDSPRSCSKRCRSTYEFDLPKGDSAFRSRFCYSGSVILSQRRKDEEACVVWGLLVIVRWSRTGANRDARS